MSFNVIGKPWLLAISIVVGTVGYFVHRFIRHRSLYRDLVCSSRMAQSLALQIRRCWLQATKNIDTCV